MESALARTGLRVSTNRNLFLLRKSDGLKICVALGSNLASSDWTATGCLISSQVADQVEKRSDLKLSKESYLVAFNMNLQLQQYLEDEHRLTAFHEAGHAAMFWFFQQQYYLKGISMASTENHWGCVMQSSITPPFTLSQLAI